MLKVVIVFILIINSILSYSNDRVLVTYIYDGDTIQVQYKNGQKERIRFIGVDCPEIYSKNKSSNFLNIPVKYLDEYAEIARNYINNLLLNEIVELIYDKKAGYRDKYRRILAYVILDDVNLSLKLIQLGYAKVFKTNCIILTDLLKSEETAKKDHIGLWKFLN